MSTQASKRKYGEDSVYFNTTANCWVAQFNSKIDGETIRKSASGATEEEAIKRLAIKKRAVLKKRASLKTVTMTFGRELEKMMAALKGTIEDKTYCDYEYRQSLLETCTFFDKRLDGIDMALIQQEITQLVLERSLCTSTCRKIIMFTKRVFKFAVSNRDIGFNPVEEKGCLKVPVAASEEKNVQPLSSDDCKALVVQLERSIILKPIIYCMLYAGLRIGEVLALRWEDLDFTNKKIHIRKAVKRYTNKSRAEDGTQPKYCFKIGPPKTKAAVRTVPMSDNLKLCLTTWKKQQKYHARDKTGLHLVFPKQNGQLQDYDSFNAVFRYFLEKVGLDPHVYHSRVFRHTYASYLVVKGKVEAKTLQALLGHTDITTTLKYYVDTDAQSKEDAAAKIDMVMNNIDTLNFQIAS